MSQSQYRSAETAVRKPLVCRPETMGNIKPYKSVQSSYRCIPSKHKFLIIMFEARDTYLNAGSLPKKAMKTKKKTVRVTMTTLRTVPILTVAPSYNRETRFEKHRWQPTISRPQSLLNFPCLHGGLRVVAFLHGGAEFWVSLT
jgi:hypothetical protein